MNWFQEDSIHSSCLMQRAFIVCIHSTGTVLYTYLPMPPRLFRPIQPDEYWIIDLISFSERLKWGFAESLSLSWEWSRKPSSSKQAKQSNHPPEFFIKTDISGFSCGSLEPSLENESRRFLLHLTTTSWECRTNSGYDWMTYSRCGLLNIISHLCTIFAGDYGAV